MSCRRLPDWRTALYAIASLWVCIRIPCAVGQDETSVFTLTIDTVKLGVPSGGQVCVQQQSSVARYDPICTPVETATQLKYNMDRNLFDVQDWLLIEAFVGYEKVTSLNLGVDLNAEGQAKFFERLETEVHQPCTVEILSPRFGETRFQLTMEIEVIGCRVPQHGTVGVFVNDKYSVLDQASEVYERDGQIVSKLHVLSSGNFPGTHRFRIVFITPDGEQQEFPQASNTSGIFSLVNRQVAKSNVAGRESYRSPFKSIELGASHTRPCRIAFFGNYKLDGQKSIWINVLRNMMQRKDLFETHYIFFMEEIPDDPFRHMLEDLEVPQVFTPLQMWDRNRKDMSADELLQEVIDALRMLLVSPLLQVRPKTCPRTVRRGIPRCNRVLSELIHLTVPPTGFAMALEVVGTLDGLDVLVFGNSKLLSDVLVQTCSELVGIPLTVVDLPNHHPVAGLHPTVIVAPSWYSHDHATIKAVHGVHKVVIYPGIDFGHFKPGPLHKTLESEIRIGFLARLSSEKIPGLFLELAEKLVRRNPTRKFRFVMAGAGDLEIDLKSLAQQRHLSIEFLGHVPYAQVPALLESLDFTVHFAMEETFCFSNIESMAMGVPMIGFGSSAVSEYAVHGVNSWIATEPTLESLVETAEAAIEQRTSETSARCAASVRNFSAQNMAQAYMHLALDMSGFLAVPS